MARLLTEYRIKRVPVVCAEDSRVVGIVSRADLVRAVAGEYRPSAQVGAGGAPHRNLLAEIAVALDHHLLDRSEAEQTGKPEATQPEAPKRRQ